MMDALALAIGVAASASWSAVADRAAREVSTVRERVEVEVVRVHPARLDTAGVAPDLTSGALRGPGAIWPLRDANGTRVGTLRVRLRRTALQDTPCRNLPEGTVLSAQDLCTTWVALHPGEQPLEAGSALGWQLRRPVLRGVPLRSSWLRPPVSVRRGQELTATASRGSATIQLRAIALSDAGLGQLVRLRGPFGRELSGLVQGNGVVALQEGVLP